MDVSSLPTNTKPFQTEILLDETNLLIMEIAYDNELTHHPPEVNDNIELEYKNEIDI